MNILVLNAGSATLKYKLFAIPGEEILASGSVDHPGGEGIVDAAATVIKACSAAGIDAIGYRVVHGGSSFTEPTRITPEVMDGLRALHDLDPLHNPTDVAMIDAGLRLSPGTPAIAVFDTSFHRTLPETAWRYALPRDLCDRLRLRRYGFHGLSYQYVTGELLKCLGRSPVGTRLIICHLGSGASVCAVQDGQSIDTSMGLTPLAGLVMGTRSGDVDPGVLLYMLRSANMTADEIDDLLNHQSGLLGLSNRSNDVRVLEQAAHTGDSNAEIALEVFAYHVCKYIGSYSAVLGGVDTVAFTGGVGEHSADVRARICRRLGFLGLRMSDEANDSAGNGGMVRISANDATVQAWVIPTDEERQVVRNAQALLGV